MKRRAFPGGGVAAVARLPAVQPSWTGVTSGTCATERLCVPAAPGQRLGQQRLIWSVSTVKPLVALTFDDGPDPELTPRILEVLAEHGVQATFNVIGWTALRHPDLVQAVVAAGHELGNHTGTHQSLAFQSALQTRRQLKRGREAIERTAGVRPRFFRLPRGNLTGSAIGSAAELGDDVLLWSVTRGSAGVGDPRVGGRSPRPHGRAT